MLTAGLQVPVMPFKEVVGKTGAVAPTQTAAIGLNVGTTGDVTVILRVVVALQEPGVGVKV